MFRHRLPSLIVVAGTLLAACGGGPVALPMEATEVGPLPAPSGEVILTITGAGRPNVGDDVQLDLEAIESLGLETVTLYEPFLNMELELTGVPVDELLAAAGVDHDAPLVWTALDDYQVHFTRREVGAENALLATRFENAPIEIADGGPLRVLFTDPEGVLGRDTNQWIWNLYQIEVG